MSAPKCVRVGHLPKWILTVILVYSLFIHIQPSMSEKTVAATSLEAKPAVELMRLRSNLLDKYQKIVRPLKNQSDVLEVKVFYDISHVVSLDEKHQTLTVNGRLKMFWTDEFLTWNPKNYSGISLVRFSPENLWWPDVMIMFSVKKFSLYEERSSPITVYSNGSVLWFPKVHCTVPCGANYRHYPFDSHNCSIIIVPRELFRYTGITVMPYRAKSNVIHAGTEWAVLGITHEAEKNANVLTPNFQQVHIRILLQRISRIYRYICVIPTLVSMASLLFGFWLLPTETSRYVIGCSNVIVLTMLLQHLVVTIPGVDVVPLIAQYSATCLCMSAIFVVVTVITKLLRDRSGRVPYVLLRLAQLSTQRHLCCILTFSQEDSLVDENIRIRGDTPDVRAFPTAGASASSMTVEEEELQRRKDWKTVSVLVDRISFWCFWLVFVVLLGVLAAV